MTWGDAKAYCQRQGGRLPRISDSDSLDGSKRSFGDKIDIFGAMGGPWPTGLPERSYWSGTVRSDRPGNSWVIHGGYSGFNYNVYVNRDASQGDLHHVVCVPALSESNASFRDFTEAELAVAGYYVRCPNDDSAACEQARKAVQELFVDFSYEEEAKHETLRLAPYTIDGNPYAYINLLGGEVLTPLEWSLKANTLTVFGGDLKVARTFQVKDSVLSGPGGLFIRVFTDSEYEEFLD